MDGTPLAIAAGSILASNGGVHAQMQSLLASAD